MTDHEHYAAMQRMAEISRRDREREEKIYGWTFVYALCFLGLVIFVGSVLEAVL